MPLSRPVLGQPGGATQGELEGVRELVKGTGKRLHRGVERHSTSGLW